jgi:tripartite ATP-independent transporter DctP family solute receptor
MNQPRRSILAGLMFSSLLLTTATQAQDIKEHAFRFALQPAKGTSQVLGAQKFADLVSAKSGGKMTVKVFENGSLGSDVAVLSSMQGGILDFSLMSVGTLASYNKQFSVFDFPYMFNNEHEADTVLDGPVGKKLLAKLPEKGFVGLAYAELGFRHVHNSKRPIKTLADLQGLKLRVIPVPIYLDFMNQEGATAVPMSYTELYPALEQGAVDGATNPFQNIEFSKMYEVTKYLSLTRHMYSAMFFIGSKKTMDKLTPDEQKVIMDAADEAKLFQRQAARDINTRSLETLKKTMTVNEISDVEIAKMRDKAKPVIEKWTREVGPDLVAEVNAELAKVRAKK